LYSGPAGPARRSRRALSCRAWRLSASVAAKRRRRCGRASVEQSSAASPSKTFTTPWARAADCRRRCGDRAREAAREHTGRNLGDHGGALVMFSCFGRRPNESCLRAHATERSVLRGESWSETRSAFGWRVGSDRPRRPFRGMLMAKSGEYPHLLALAVSKSGLDAERLFCIECAARRLLGGRFAYHLRMCASRCRLGTWRACILADLRRTR